MAAITQFGLSWPRRAVFLLAVLACLAVVANAKEATQAVGELSVSEIEEQLQVINSRANLGREMRTYF